MAKVLFLPSYLGGGFGHISRCLALAKALEARGWTAAFALGGYHADRVASSGLAVYHLMRPYVPVPEGSDGPAYTVFTDMNYQLVRDGLNHFAEVRACVAEQFKVLRSFQPDLLVSDSWPLASILSRLSGIPLVQIVRSINHPFAHNLMWWKEIPQGMLSPDPRPVFNPLLSLWGLPPIEKAEDLLQGDLYLVPSIPELDPLPENLPRTHYTGPLIQPHKPGGGAPAWSAGLDLDRPLIYVTVGGGAGPVGGPRFYQTLFEAFEGKEFNVIASTGARLSLHDLPEAPPNFRLHSWLPGPAVIAQSELVIYPGGYGTTMELVQAGVPGLAIPFHTEQESNGRRLEAAGAGKVVLPGQEPPLRVSHRWAGGPYSFLVYPKSSISPALLRQAALDLLSGGQARAQARRLQDAAASYGGPEYAAGLVDELIQTSSKVGVAGWRRLKWYHKLSLANFPS